MFQLNKTLAFSAFFAVCSFAQTWTACTDATYSGYCKWGGPSGTGCDQLAVQSGTSDTCEKKYNDCVGGSTLYSDATCTTYKAGIEPSTEATGCCKWADPEKNPDGMCWTLYTEKEATDCKTGTNSYWTGACPNAQGGCPGGATSSGSTGSSSSAGGSSEYCKWPATAEDEGGCFLLENPNAPNTNPANEGMTNREVCIYFSQGIFNNSACTGTPVAGGPNAPQKGQCVDNQGRGLFCNWPTGCFRLTTNEVQTTCAAAITNCGSRTYWGVDGTQLTEDNVYGEGLSCANIGGQLYTAPSSSSTGGNTPSSSSGGTVNPGTSSSSYKYCVVSGSQICLEGPFTSCQSGSQLSNSCPYLSSSSSGGTVNPGTSSSSSLPAGSYKYCVVPSGQVCLDGPFTSCQSGAFLSNSCPYQTPIMISKIASANGAQLIKNGVSLQVTKNATLEVFNLSGKRVRKLNFTRGDWSVPLSDMAKGLYIVKVSFGSEAKILQVPVK